MADSAVTQIVSGAAGCLGWILAGHWTRIQVLSLSNMACNGDFTIFHGFDSRMHPNLKHVRLAQCVFVDPVQVVGALSRLQNVHEFNLVDAYHSSIWERRIRISDIQLAWVRCDEAGWPATAGPLPWATVAQKLRCLVERQRLDGGDRGDDMPHV